MWFAGPAPEAPPPRSGSLRPGFHLEPGLKVGLLGGSFNPAHEGHAHVAETALIRLGLDRVVWLVSPQNPLKDARQTAPLADRMASARAVAPGPKMIVSDFETRIGAVYTIDTLGEFPPQPHAPEFRFDAMPCPFNGEHRGQRHEIPAGSYAEIPAHPKLTRLSSCTLAAFIWPTTPAKGTQAIMGNADGPAGIGLVIDGEGRLALTAEIGRAHV